MITLELTCADGDVRIDYREVFAVLRRELPTLAELPALPVSDALELAWRSACADTEKARERARTLTCADVRGAVESRTASYLAPLLRKLAVRS